ncbi:hypothetical protein [Sphingomonas sp. ACRSK]|uniref:hypothetical protein n=1 Tax=Sphingomonas sp. ACRSK TaxID=2918213 RepID=UPI001EF4ADE3|nr:hypothetical protein [Sphingomonas sp. ACRSK]MCG7348199.1 hypothetical protein [Sphingomonas sp. ACRSK]
MATQFKHIDFPAAQAPSRAPAAALVAINQAFGGTPEQTLDEVADQPQPLDLAAWDAALAKAEAAIAARDAHWDEQIEPLLADAGVELRTEPNWQAYLPLSRVAADAAVELAKLAPPSPNGLILAIRLLCETARLDVVDPIAGDGEAVVDAIKRHAGDLLESAAAPAPYMGGLLAHWQRLYDNVIEDQREMRAYRDGTLAAAHQRFEAAAEDDREAADATLLAAEKEFDVRVASYDDSRIRLYLTPAPSPAEMAVKLKLIEEERDWDLARVAEVMTHLAIDARRFGRLGAFIQSDADLLAAFAELRSDEEHWFAFGPDLEGNPWNIAADARSEAAREVILTTRATTIEGVLAKLRQLFPAVAGDAWSDHAMVDPRHPDFLAGLREADSKTRQLWGAIDDLAKLGGVDLAAMGADDRPKNAEQAAPAAVEPRKSGPAQPAADDSAGLHNILQERNAALSGLDKADLSDDEGKAICRHMYELEERLFDTPSATSNDVMTKLLLIAQIVEEGFECNQELAAKVLAEARGLGLAEPARPWIAAA